MDNVKLGSAQPSRSVGGHTVSHVELCQCPEGYVGQFCESCAPGYHRDPASGGPYARCVPCNCNGHSDTCDINTGESRLPVGQWDNGLVYRVRPRKPWLFVMQTNCRKTPTKSV